MLVVRGFVLVLVSFSLAVAASLPAAASGPVTPPNAARLLTRSLTTMQRTVRSVHTTAVSPSLIDDSAGETEQPTTVYSTASCTNSGQNVAARVDQRVSGGPSSQVIELWHLGQPARIWTRDGRSHLVPWIRDNVRPAALINVYCPGSPLYLAMCAVSHEVGTACPRWVPRLLPNLQDLGTERWSGHTTWHLQSVLVVSTCCFGTAKSPGVETEVLDLYIDKTSLRIVHTVDRQHTESADGSFVGDAASTYTYAQFNTPVTITKPKNVAPVTP